MSATMFITGASSGIGRSVAELALAEGWRVGLFRPLRGGPSRRSPPPATRSSCPAT